MDAGSSSGTTSGHEYSEISMQLRSLRPFVR